MKIEHTGTHIEPVYSIIIQKSESQSNALAFVDTDGHWIHIDKKIIDALYRFNIGVSTMRMDSDFKL